VITHYDSGKFYKSIYFKIIREKSGCIPNCRIAGLFVGGGDTAHGWLPRLVSPPTGDNLECAQKSGSINIENIAEVLHAV
jgi:hypothetical protein